MNAMTRLAFPRVHSSSDARCWRCSAPLGEARESGQAQGQGSMRAPCTKCSAATWFDIIPEGWTKTKGGDWQLAVPEGSFWIGDASGSRSGMFEVEFTTTDLKARHELGRTKSEDAAKKLCEKKLRALRKAP